MSPRTNDGNNMSSQREVIAFLSSPAAYGPAAHQVDRIETHGAIVFLTGEDAYKIKKAVRFSYLDFSTLDLRRRACQREIELNQPHAPDLYLGIVAVTRGADGALRLGANGMPIEWAVHMRRFPQGSLLSDVVERGELGGGLAREAADAIVNYHRSARIVRTDAGAARIGKIICEVAAALRSPTLRCDPARANDLEAGCVRQLDRIRLLLERRAQSGLVRRCHGDLHLGNIVLWHGHPTLFDAIEFDEDIATIDMLYDLAFLLMDLDARHQRATANTVLNRYLWRSQEILDLEGLAALPLFLGLRAAIRGMVAAQRAVQATQSAGEEMMAASRTYLDAAAGYLVPAKPRLVAVGGLSGTGKSTLAAALASRIGPAPGAVHLRSDLERKSMFAVEETERLPPECYSADVGHRVYDQLRRKSRAALAAGHSVIVDAVFLQHDERRSHEEIARALSLPFQGVWLTASLDTLIARVDARSGDASDATGEVVQRQAQMSDSSIEWVALDASRSPEAVLQAALGIVAIR